MTQKDLVQPQYQLYDLVLQNTQNQQELEQSFNESLNNCSTRKNYKLAKKKTGRNMKTKKVVLNIEALQRY